MKKALTKNLTLPSPRMPKRLAIEEIKLVHGGQEVASQEALDLVRRGHIIGGG